MGFHGPPTPATIFKTNPLSLLRIHLDFDIICALLISLWSKYVHVNPFNSVLVHYFYNEFAFVIENSFRFRYNLCESWIYSSNSEITIDSLWLSSIRIHFNTNPLFYGSFTLNSLFSSSWHFRYDIVLAESLIS